MARRKWQASGRLLVAVALLGAGVRARAFNCYVALQDPRTGHRVLLLGEEHDNPNLDDNWKSLFAEVDKVRSARRDPGKPVESSLLFEWQPWHVSKSEALPEWVVPEASPGSYRVLERYRAEGGHETIARLVPGDLRRPSNDILNQFISGLSYLMMRESFEKLVGRFAEFRQVAEKGGKPALFTPEVDTAITVAQYRRQLDANSREAREFGQNSPNAKVHAAFHQIAGELALARKRFDALCQQAGTEEDAPLTALLCGFVAQSKDYLDLLSRLDQVAFDVNFHCETLWGDANSLRLILADRAVRRQTLLSSGAYHTIQLREFLTFLGYRIEAQDCSRLRAGGEYREILRLDAGAAEAKRGGGSTAKHETKADTTVETKAETKAETKVDGAKPGNGSDTEGAGVSSNEAMMAAIIKAFRRMHRLD